MSKTSISNAINSLLDSMVYFLNELHASTKTKTFSDS